MFIVLYEFVIKAGFENQFESNWHIQTEYIYKLRGSLGSRLHRAKDGTYIAYAQWPSEEKYFAEVTMPLESVAAHRLMKDACSEIKTLKLMTVTDDLLKKNRPSYLQTIF